MKQERSQLAIGIDLGSSQSSVAICRDGEVTIIENDFDERATPSYVTFTETQRLIGLEAKNCAIDYCPNTVYDVKRLVGRWFHDEQIQCDKKRWPFNVVDHDGMPMVEVHFKRKKFQFGAEEISAMIIGNLKQTAEKYLNEEVTKAVISVPAYFNLSQRQATIDAGRIAGLEVLGIINEPTAAAYCYRMKFNDLEPNQTKNVLIFDLGGGTFDVSVVQIDGDQFTVLATDGDSHLGGDDFDHLLVEECLKRIKQEHGEDLRPNKRAKLRLRKECERARITLSGSKQTIIKVDYLLESLHFSMSVTRTQFEQLGCTLFRSTLETVERVISAANLNKTQIDDIVLVGGCSRTPMIRQLLRQYFEKQQFRESINPDCAVVHGAAIQAAILNQNQRQTVPRFSLQERTPFAIGFQINSPDSDKSTVSDQFTVFNVFETGTVYPTQKTVPLTTSYHNQTSVMLPIYQGKRLLRKYRDFHRIFQFDGIRKTNGKKAHFLLLFEIDMNGCLKIDAQDPNSGSSFGNRFLDLFIFSLKEEIQKKMKDARQYLMEDREHHDRILAKNDLERVTYELKSRIETMDNQHDMLAEFSKLLDGTLNWFNRDELFPRAEYEAKLYQMTSQFNCVIGIAHHDN